MLLVTSSRRYAIYGTIWSQFLEYFCHVAGLLNALTRLHRVFVRQPLPFFRCSPALSFPSSILLRFPTTDFPCVIRQHSPAVFLIAMPCHEWCDMCGIVGIFIIDFPALWWCYLVQLLLRRQRFCFTPSAWKMIWNEWKFILLKREIGTSLNYLRGENYLKKKSQEQSNGSTFKINFAFLYCESTMLSDEKQVMLGMIFERKAVPFSTSIKNHDDPPTDFFPYFSFFFFVWFLTPRYGPKGLKYSMDDCE